MITRNRAAAKTSRGKKRRLSGKAPETKENISLFQNFINGQIKNNIESVLKGVTRILELKEIEVNTLKEKVESLERAKAEVDKENLKLKGDLSRAKSCADCKTKGEEVKTLTKCLENLKEGNEKEKKKLREHIFIRKKKIEKYVSILKERDEKIEDLESELAELKLKMEDTEDSVETKRTTESTETMKTTETKRASLEEKEDVKVKSKPEGNAVLRLIDTTLLGINSKKESSEVEEELKLKKIKKHSKAKIIGKGRDKTIDLVDTVDSTLLSFNSSKESSEKDEEILKTKSKSKIIGSTASVSARPGEPAGKEKTKTKKRNRS